MTCDHHACVAPRPRVFILTGAVDSGKTRLLQRLAAEARGRGIRVGGFLAHGEYEGDRKVGYRLEGLARGEGVVIARRIPDRSDRASPAGILRIGRFALQAEGFGRARGWLARDAATADLIIVDELGPLELSGRGHAQAVGDLLGQFPGVIVLAIRRDCLAQTLGQFGLARRVEVFDVSQGDELIGRVLGAASRGLQAQ